MGSLTALLPKEFKMAKKIDAYIKLQIPAGKANPSPPLALLWVNVV
jgi:hypothetical protein